jgi:hypothetical protein
VKLTNGLVAGVVVLVAVVVAGVVALSMDLSETARLAIIPSLTTGVLAIATSLLTLVKTNEMHHDLQNGLIPKKVREAVTEMADDAKSPTVTIENGEKPT